jgi:hypothetical protein
MQGSYTEVQTRRVRRYKRSNQGRTRKDRQEEFEYTKGVIRDSTPKKDTQEEFEDTKGVIRGLTRKDRREEFADAKGVNRGRTLKKDRQEEFEDTKVVIRVVHRRTYQKSLKIQRSNQGSYTAEGQTIRV